MRVFENQTADDFAVINADDPICRPIRGKALRIPFSRAGAEKSGSWAEAGWLYCAVRGQERALLEQSRISLAGAHNLENALAALAAADCLQTPDAAIAEGLSSFPGLPHRTQLVARQGGVSWID